MNDARLEMQTRKVDFLLQYYSVCYDSFKTHSSRVIIIHGWSLTVLVGYIGFTASQKYLENFSSVIIGTLLLIAFNIIELLERRYVYRFGIQLKK